MPEQSAGGSLTKRPLQPRPENPAQVAPGTAGVDGAADEHALDVDARTRIAAAVDSWRRSLARSELPDTLLASGPEATASWLDLTSAHPGGLAPLFAARPTRLSSLFREPAAHAAAVKQARAIRISAMALSAQRGVHAACLAIGVASWRPAGSSGPIQAPVVLRGCSIRPHPSVEDDFDLDLDDGVLINPELVRELVESYGIEADAAQLATLTHGEKGFDPRPVYAWLEERCRSLRAFKIERSLILATFAAGSGAVLADLDASVSAIAGHRLLGPLAAGAEVVDLGVAETLSETGDVRVVPAQADAPVGENRRLAVVGRLGPRSSRVVEPPAEPDPANELLVLDLDPAQQDAVSAVLRGENVVVEGPPGTGATHTLAAAIGGLVAAGRRVLVLSPRRASTDSLVHRLAAAGLGDLVLDARDSVTGQQATRTAKVASGLRAGLDAATDGPLRRLPNPGQASEDDDVIAALRASRDLLDGEAAALHEVRPPWGISLYDGIVALSELRARQENPSSDVRLPDQTLASLDAVTRERLRVHLHSAAAAGAFTLSRADTRWFDAQVTTATQARAALEAALVLRSTLEHACAAMESVTTAAGLRPAAVAADWVPLLEVLLGVRQVVDAMSADIYEQPLDELIAAVAPRGLRSSEGMARGERRRLRKQAQSLVRAGVYVENLYETMVLAREQNRRWRELSIDGNGPRVVSGLTEANGGATLALQAIDVLVQVFTGTPHPDPRLMRLPDLVTRVFDLAGDSAGILGQPRRANLIDGLTQAGLGPLVTDFQRRRIGPDAIDAEFDLVWWSSVRDSIVRSDRRLFDHDPQRTTAATAALRQAEAAHVEAGAGLVKAAVARRASRVVTQHADQVRALRQELAREDRRPRMVDLVRRCGDVLAAIAPIWVMSPDTVAAALAQAEPGSAPIVDTVVVDDAGHIALPEVVAALARGRQVLVAGDRRRQSVPAESGPSVIGMVTPFARLARLDRDHRTRDGRMMVALTPSYPEGWHLTPGTSAGAPLHLDVVADGVAVPSPGEELPVSSDAEVRRVLDLVQAHAVGHPGESLAVVTLSERHAERIEEALRAESGDRPALARWLADTWKEGRDQAFVVRPVQRVLGLERDAVIVSVGLARTPHGRILHRFGAIDAPSGAASLITALSRARNRTTVVCCFEADDLVVDRLRTPGARLLRETLLLASGRGVGRVGRTAAAVDGLVSDLRDRLAGAGLPIQTRLGDGAWPLDLAVADPREPGRLLVAVDVDGPAFATMPCREREWHRPLRWERAGFEYIKVSALDLFSDPAREVQRIKEAWQRGLARPLPAALPVAGAGEVASDAVSAGPDEPVLPQQTGDDTDEGWGERDDTNRDDELQRERPPHWE